MVEFRQVWHGSVDLGALLSEIGGWHVGCQNHEETAEAVALCEAKGWIGRRVHYAPVFPDGVAAFEITETGLKQLEAWGRDAKKVAEVRKWYRDNSAKPLVAI